MTTESIGFHFYYFPFLFSSSLLLSSKPNSNEWLMMNKGSNVNSTTVHSPYSILRDGWEIDPSKIILETQLSEGAFGEVHKGYIVGPLTNPKLLSELRKNVTIPVAVKMNKS